MPWHYYWTMIYYMSAQEKHLRAVLKRQSGRRWKIKNLKKYLIKTLRTDILNKLSQKESKHIDNWTTEQSRKFTVFNKQILKFQRTKTKVKREKMNSQMFIFERGQILTWEFDPGSGWTLAACLIHASRTECAIDEASADSPVHLVADGWVTRG